MKSVQIYMICSASVLLLKPTTAYPQAGLEQGGSRARRFTCREDQYQRGGLCCLKCRAGTYVKSHCTEPDTTGQCEECDYDTYTEHENGLSQCFKCTQCRPDQEIVRPCTHTEDTACQCKSGRFCDPDQACEVCKKCSRCAQDEEIVRNCTSTTNTECKKIQNKSDSASVTAVVAVLCVVVLAAIIGACIYKRRCTTDSGRNRPDKVESECTDTLTAEDEETQRPTSTNRILSRPLVRVKSSTVAEDECKILSESLNSSASNSQHSLTGLLTSASQASPVVPDQHHWREDEPLTKLVPVKDDESLKRCFEFFEELDVNYHKRFFRQIEISDNVIKSKENLPYEDRIHELLNIWVEKEGKGASLNNLLQALIVLNQRRTAEMIHQKALDSGHYRLPV